MASRESFVQISPADPETQQSGKCDQSKESIKSSARDLVLKGPPDIAVFDCPCRQTREHPYEPKQVCMVVGQPFVDFIFEHHPHTSRRLTPVEAAQLLQEEHERGHVHTAYFKDAMLNRFYALCNCCKCCCGGIEAMMKHGVPMVTSSGYVAQVNEVMYGA